MATFVTIFGAKNQAQDIVRDSIPIKSIENTKLISPVELLKSDPSTVQFPAELSKSGTTYNTQAGSLEIKEIQTFLDSINVADLLDTERFIEKYKTNAPEINFDSIFSLPQPQIEKYILAARQRQIPTLQINKTSWKEYQRLIKKLGTVPYGMFHENFNMIELRYFETLDIPKSKKHIRVLLEAMNRELPFNYIHEKGHSIDRLHRNLGGLTQEQTVQYEYYYEHIQKVLRMLIGGKVYRATGSIKKAFPELAAFAEIKYLAGNPGNSLDEPISTENIQKYWGDFKPYILYLLKNKDTGLSAGEIAVIFDASAQSMRMDARYYAEKQICAPDRIQTNITNSYYACREWAKTRTGTLQDFDSLISDMYMGLLESVPKEVIASLLDSARSYIEENQVIQKTIAASGDYKKFLDYCSFVRNAAGIAEKQNLDVATKIVAGPQIAVSAMQAER
ncbi:MAG: hypothetical protein LBJ73_05270 [Rickettsiales bacterium]|nr:hypothetical protein [Rickettsiales bacterium]